MGRADGNEAGYRVMAFAVLVEIDPALVEDSPLRRPPTNDAFGSSMTKRNPRSG